ncbi:SH3 domain-containing YSC84-like protein 1 isoform X1 [Conger conger]|uniref:SH3 domain-containing YSC84-like protein 1 isoform X1 n=2 Tax=Conger conger TaxID=82655 RepID=UPI002A5A110A|nr:SH3 domain-containing YSC84-like protein 1 isoform X1 [Conger conger]
MSNPIPSNLPSEMRKAAKILRDFTQISNRNGPDKLIPAHVIAKAEGLAIISVIKAGFMITARGGSGIVIARLPDGRWSAPSAMGIAGLGGGFEIGVEVSDLIVILNYRRAIEAFAKGGNLTLGGNCTVAVGPMGRNIEADVALRSTAAVFTYCRSRGLFAGVSLEGSCLIERRETNRKFYSQDIRPLAILSGEVEPPPAAQELYSILDDYTEKYTTEWQSKNLRQSTKSVRPPRPRPPSQRPAPTPSPALNNTYSPAPSSTYSPAPSSTYIPTPIVGPAPTQWAEDVKPSLYPSVSAFQTESAAPSRGAGGPPVVVTAMHAFAGQQPGDLSFSVGDKITVTTKTESQYDWWEGQLHGRVGIFPANFVSFS